MKKTRKSKAQADGQTVKSSDQSCREKTVCFQDVRRPVSVKPRRGGPPKFKGQHRKLCVKKGKRRWVQPKTAAFDGCVANEKYRARPKPKHSKSFVRPKRRMYALLLVSVADSTHQDTVDFIHEQASAYPNSTNAMSLSTIASSNAATTWSIKRPCLLYSPQVRSLDASIEFWILWT